MSAPSTKQYVRHDETTPYCINVLTASPFAVVTHPDSDSWRIVTAADLNARAPTKYLFTYYAETARAVSGLIRRPTVSRNSRGSTTTPVPAGERWRTAVDESVDLHPVEFMSIADLKEIVRNNECLLDELGFPSKTRCGDASDTVETYRNKVMHGNRRVVSGEADVVDLVASLELACDIAVEAGGDAPA